MKPPLNRIQTAHGVPMIRMDAETGEMVFEGPDGRLLGRMWLRAGELDSRKGELEFTTKANGSGLEIRWSIENTGDEEFRLHEVCLEGVIEGAGPVENGSIRFLDGMSGGGFTKVECGKSHRSENNLFLTFRNAQDKVRRSMIVGGLSYEDFAKVAEMEIDPESGQIDFRIRARDAVGRLIEAGQVYAPNDGFYCDFFQRDPFETLEQYGLAVREAMGANPNAYDFLTVCGWYASMAVYGAGNYINNSSGLVQEAEAARESGLTKYTRIACRLVPDTYDRESLRDIDPANFHSSILSADRNTEQGWWDDEHFRKFGHLTEPYETIEKWGKAMAERDAIPILYVQSGLVSYDYAKGNPGHMLGNDISRLDEVFEKTPYVSYDYTDPDFQEHLKKRWAAMGAAGIRGVMFDYPHLAWHDDGGFEDRKSTAAAAYRTMFRLAKEGLGRDSWIQENLVKKRWPHYTEMSVGLVDSQRICADNDRVRPEFYRRGALRWYKNRVLYNYDMDAKHLHRVLPGNADGRRQMLTMLYVTTSRFLLAHTTAWLNRELLHDISRVYPVHTAPKSPRPLDAFISDDCPSIFDFEVNDGWHQVVLYNEDLENAVEKKVGLSDEPAEGGMGLDAASEYYAYDFWNETFVGRIVGSGALKQTLRPGEARMLSVRKVLDQPQVVSTNRHIMQGYLDLHDVKWDTSAKVLSGEADVIEGEAYELAIAANGSPVISASAENAECWISGASWDKSLFHLRLSSETSRRVKWSLSFGEAMDKSSSVRRDLSHNNSLLLEDGKTVLMDSISVGYRMAGGRPVSSLDGRFALASERTPFGEQLSFTDSGNEQVDLVLHLRKCGDCAWRMNLELINRGPKPVRIESVEVIEGRLPGCGVAGKVIPNGYWVGYRGEDEKIYTPEAGCTYRNSFWTLTVEKPALAAGFTTGEHTVNRFDLRLQDGDLGIRAYGEADDVTLPAGGRRISDELFISFKPDALAEMERFAVLAGESNKVGVIKENHATWCSWYSGWMGRQKQQYLRNWKGGLEAGVTSQIRPISEVFSKRGGAGMRIVDDSREMSLGDWDDVTEKMPLGYSRMAQLMDAARITPGVWITPFYVGTASRLFKEHPEWIALDEEGKQFLPGYAGIPCGILDSTTAGAIEHFREMGRLWRERGFHYVMTDFLRSQYFAPVFEDRTKTKTEAHRMALKALREGFGEDTFWLACTALPGPCMGLADSFRVSGDSFGGITKKGGPFAYTQCAYRWFYHRRVWLNDPDSVITRGYWDFKKKEYVRESHPVEYLRAYFSWIALAGLVVTYGDTFDDDLPEENIEIYRKIFPPMDIAGRPLDIWENDPHYLWGVRASDNREHPALLGAFTLFEKQPIRLKINLAEAVRRIDGFDSPSQEQTDYIVWDYWRGEEIALNGGLLELELDPSTCRVLAISLRGNRPCLVSSSGHFSQGAHEIPDLSWKDNPKGGGSLAGEVSGNGGDATTLYFWIPSECGEIKATLDGKPVELSSVGGGIHALVVPESDKPMLLNLSVSSCPTPSKPASHLKTKTPLIELIH